METRSIDRALAYRRVLEKIRLLLEGEEDWVSAMATVVCALHEEFSHFDWTGFYRVVDADTLKVGPYQGSLGCQRIDMGRGVCGSAAAERRTHNVADVHEFPGHIACDPRSSSEIVVPVLRADGTTLAVLDVDSHQPAAFTRDDVTGLEELCRLLGERYG